MGVLIGYLVLNLPLLIASGCDTDWHELAGHCYRMYSSTTPISGAALTARLACREQGGDLATIKSQAEQNFIHGLFSQDGQTTGEAYIGLSDAKQEGIFTWLDGSSPIYLNWNPDEPNDWTGFGGEQCGSILRIQGQWMDVPCLTNQRFIDGYVCEKLSSTPAQQDNSHFCRITKHGFLSGFTIEIVHTRSKTHCFIACLAHVTCLSANYKHSGVAKGTCHLNNASRYESREAWITDDVTITGINGWDWHYLEHRHPGF